MFRTLINNLSQNQKIVALLLSQFVVVIILIVMVQTFMGEKRHVEIDTTATNNSALPARAEEFVSENIWQVIKANIPGVDESKIDDVVIREGTYVEEKNDDGSVRVTFLVDIDSLKQTYRISTGWTKDKKTIREVVVDCPPIDEMKYPETVCHGMYNDSNSLSLYFPYSEYSEEAEDDETLAPNYLISADEKKKEINIMVSVCDADRFKEEAMKYLEEVPIDLKDYKINVGINSINVGC